MTYLAGAPILALKPPKILFEKEKEEQGEKVFWGSFLTATVNNAKYVHLLSLKDLD